MVIKEIRRLFLLQTHPNSNLYQIIKEMSRFKLCIILLFILNVISLKAQENEVIFAVRAGDNTTFGGFAAFSLETYQTFNENLVISGGVQYNTIGRTVVHARPSYFHDFPWGTLSGEVILDYTNLASVGSYAAGAGICLARKWIDVKLGYYWHLYGGAGGHIVEPFNIYYELRAKFLHDINDWDLNLLITNNEIFELERHYQPSFIAQCLYYPSKKIGINMSIGCKPAGIFNISADYYQSFIKAGIIYRW